MSAPGRPKGPKSKTAQARGTAAKATKRDLSSPSPRSAGAAGGLIDTGANVITRDDTYLRMI